MAFSDPIFMKLEFPQQPKEEMFYPELIKVIYAPEESIVVIDTVFKERRLA